MRFIFTGAGLFLVLAVSLAACSGDSGQDPCLVDCENQHAACGGSADAGGISCTELCSLVKSNNPAQCHDKIDAVFRCAIEKVTYSCPNGVFTVTPQGACAAEYTACAQCTGKLFCYIDLP